MWPDEGRRKRREEKIDPLSLKPALPPELAKSGILLAWSGGLDSTALLYLLREWAARHGAALHALHIDHRLRPSSGEDVAFCRHIAAKLGVPFGVKTLAVDPNGSTQQNARIQRYAALARAANRLGLGCVATAHHADDALETALLNLRRGTSTGGLSASGELTPPPIPGWPANLRLARPFARIFRSDILAYAEARQIDWHEDPSNATSAYQRNHLRHDILPALTEDGRYSKGILRSLENLAAEHTALEQIAASSLRTAWLRPPDAESIALRCAPLQELPPAVATRALQLAIRHLPAEVALTRKHRDLLAEGIASGDTLRLDIRGGVVHLTPTLLVVEVGRGRGAPHLSQREAHAIPLSPPTVARPNLHEIPWFGSTFCWEKAGPDESAKVYDFGIASAPSQTSLIIRAPKPGDRMKIAGLSGHKSVASLLSEAQIPEFLRWRWPCLAQNTHTQQVEWVCGIRHGEHALKLAPCTVGDRLRWKIVKGSVFDHLISTIP